MSVGFVSSKKEKFFQELLSKIGTVDEQDLEYLPELLSQAENTRSISNLTLAKEIKQLLYKLDRYINNETNQQTFFDLDNVQDFVYTSDPDTETLLNPDYKPNYDFDEKRSLLIEKTLHFCKEIVELNYNNIIQITLLEYYAKYLLDEHRLLVEEKELLEKSIQDQKLTLLQKGLQQEKLVSSVKTNKEEAITHSIIDEDTLKESPVFEEKEEISEEETVDEDSSESSEVEDELAEAEEDEADEAEIVFPKEKELPKKEVKAPSYVPKVTVLECFGSKEEFNRKMFEYYKVLFDSKPEWERGELFEKLKELEPHFFSDKSESTLGVHLMMLGEFLRKDDSIPYTYKAIGKNEFGKTIYKRVLKTEELLKEGDE